MSLAKAKELRHERAAIFEAATKLLDAAEAEGRDLSNEESDKWDGMHVDIDALGKRIDRLEKQESVDRALIGIPSGAYAELDGSGTETREAKPDPVRDRVTGFYDFLTRGRMPKGAKRDHDGIYFRLHAVDDPMLAECPPEVREAIALENRYLAEYRAQSVGTDTEGGFLVPQGFSNMLERTLLAFGGMRQARTSILRTATGNPLDWPTLDDTANKGALLGENTQDSDQDLVFGNKVLNAYKYTSNFVKVSVEMAQDASLNPDRIIAQALGERLGRIMNQHATTGTGTAQPNGVVTASALGKTLASSTAITHDELLDLKHSVDPAYRVNAEWMFNDSTLLVLKKLKDQDLRPLWQPGIAVREPSTLDGDGYVINQDMPSLEAAVKPVLYGDFSRFYLRDVLDISLTRLAERYAEFHQIAFVAIMRFDSELIAANAIKHALTPSP